jgi:D-psicose/D-tagatose/L-ribulose 3-epimerase
VRFAICNEIFEDRSVEDGFAAIADTGYEGVEIAPFTLGATPESLSSSDRTRIRSAAAAHSLEVTGLHWLLARTDGMHVSSAEPETAVRTRRRLAELTGLCADLGGRFLVFGSPAQRSTPAGMSREEARARAVDTFRDWAAHAERSGVTICLEGLPADETDFMNSTADVIEVVHAVNSPAVRLVLDVKSMSAESLPMPDLIRSAQGELAYVQVNDANRGGPGFGDTDLVPVLQTLREIGYDGFVSVEAFEFPTGREDVATRSLAYLRRSARLAGIDIPATPSEGGPRP